MGDTQGTAFPSPWNGHGIYMVPALVAVWFPSRNDYQIYKVDRTEWPILTFHPTNTSRPDGAFHFACEDAETQSRLISVRRMRARVHKVASVAIWHTGGWLCRLVSNVPEPVIPIMGVSNPEPFQFVGNVGIRESEKLEAWKGLQTSRQYTQIAQTVCVRNVDSTDTQKNKDMDPPPSIPSFVAEALVESAQRKQDSCPITLEPIVAGESVATSCFHVFSRSAMSLWKSSNSAAACPLCKQGCSIVNC